MKARKTRHIVSEWRVLKDATRQLLHLLDMVEAVQQENRWVSDTQKLKSILRVGYNQELIGQAREIVEESE
jgi:hypothetical protein